MQEELGNIAPEMDLRTIDPAADLREALDIDSMDFLNFVIAVHHRLGVDIPELDYPKLVTLDGAVGYLRRSSDQAKLTLRTPAASRRSIHRSGSRGDAMRSPWPAPHQLFDPLEQRIDVGLHGCRAPGLRAPRPRRRTRAPAAGRNDGRRAAPRRALSRRAADILGGEALDRRT